MCFALLVPGCAKVPQGREAITKVQITGLPNGSRERFKAGIATQETPQFLGTVPWFLEYKVFDQSALEVDLTRIARELRRMGYYGAHVYAARIIKVTDEKVRVEIAVDLGEAVFVTRLETSGLSNIELTPEADRAVARARVLEPKSQFSEEKLNQSKQQIVKTLADFGYAYAEAEGKAEVDIGTHSATVRLSIKPGLRATLGDVRIIGCRSIPEAKVRSITLFYQRKGWLDSPKFSRRDAQVHHHRPARYHPLSDSLRAGILRSTVKSTARKCTHPTPRATRIPRRPYQGYL